MKHAFRLLLMLTVAFVFINGACTNASTPTQFPENGTYDGTIGREKLILVITSSNKKIATGYYIHNRNNVLEKQHKISFELINNKVQIMSDEFWGILQGSISPSKIKGSIHLNDAKFRLFFWRNRRNVSFERRTDFQIPTIRRYKQEIFGSVNVLKDIKYGEAIGYWTETPYLDEPYIEILTKGMVNLFKGEKELDLKLDLYQPVGDVHQLRPLVLLIHGGAFYIGNKQSPTEQIMAERLTRLGYVVASMDYRMGFKLKGDDIQRSGYKAIQDVHAALRFLSSKAKQLGIDPMQVYVAGTSAGAMAALNIAFLDNDERPACTYGDKKDEDLGNIETSGNKLTNAFEIKAVTNMWGAVSDTGIIDANERIPVLSYHGDQDDIVPIDNSHPFQNTMRINRLIMDKIYGSQPIHEQLDRLGIENKLIILKGKGHEPQLDNFKSINSIIYNILDEMTTMLYQQTISSPFPESSSLSIASKGKPSPLQIDGFDEELRYIDIKGGIRVSNNPNDLTIIWFKNELKPQITIYSRNKFDAWNSKILPVIIN